MGQRVYSSFTGLGLLKEGFEYRAAGSTLTNHIFTSRCSRKAGFRELKKSRQVLLKGIILDVIKSIGSPTPIKMGFLFSTVFHHWRKECYSCLSSLVMGCTLKAANTNGYPLVFELTIEIL